MISTAGFHAMAQDCTATANGNNINVNAGQVICVMSNISNANVNIAAGGVLKVGSGYTLSIQNFNNFSGTLVNNGTLSMGSMSFASGGTLVNNSQVTFNGTPNFNGSATITNNTGATITYNATFSLGNASTINNYGTIIAYADMTGNQGTYIYNYGRLEVRNGNFNTAGSLTNNGFLKVINFINLNGGTVYNNCRMVAGNGFNNSSVFLNDGLVWVTNATSGKIQNNAGSWTNTYSGKLRGVDFINNAPLSGSGEFYFTGDTRQQSSFSGSYNSPDSFIKFFDNSLSAPQVAGSYFDFGIQGARVARPASMVPGDTSSYNGTCAQQTFDPAGTIPLPLQLIRFQASARNGDVLLDWETTREVNTKVFVVEHSVDGVQWSKIGTVAAAGSTEFNTYRFAHYHVQTVTNLYRLKMEDTDGKATYSPVVSIVLNSLAADKINVYPNPFFGKIAIHFNNPAVYGKVNILVTDMTGRLMKTMNVTTAEADNEQEMDLSGLHAGVYLLLVRDVGNGTVLLNKKIIKNGAAGL